MATGSGKTLLMHANILQYQHYLDKHGRRGELNRIILLTPNEGLSQQHLREFELADIEAEIFDKDARPDFFRKQPVEILEVTRLRDESGEKTVAIEAFDEAFRAEQKAIDLVEHAIASNFVLHSS